jgi:phosphonate transport system permease protein
LDSHLYRLSDQQAAALLSQYGAAVAAKRRRALFLVFAVAVCTALAAWAGEVDLRKFAEGLPRFWSYLYDILPKLRLMHFSADFAEWFWNWDGWLSLLAETLLVAYVGTFLGTSIGFVLCFFASANLMSNAIARAFVRRSLECEQTPGPAR